MPKVNLLPLAVLVMTFFSPMAIVMPALLVIAVEGLPGPSWWAYAQLCFLPGFISVVRQHFIPCWDLLRWWDDSLFGSYAISDTLLYLTMSSSWVVVGLMLYANTLMYSRGKLNIRLASVATVVLLLAEIILPYLILFNLEIWRITGLIPLPFPGIIASLGIAHYHFHKSSGSLSTHNHPVSIGLSTRRWPMHLLYGKD